jgi:hypothetical protein
VRRPEAIIPLQRLGSKLNVQEALSKASYVQCVFCSMSRMGNYPNEQATRNPGSSVVYTFSVTLTVVLYGCETWFLTVK